MIDIQEVKNLYRSGVRVGFADGFIDGYNAGKKMQNLNGFHFLKECLMMGKTFFCREIKKWNVMCGTMT